MANFRTLVVGVLLVGTTSPAGAQQPTGFAVERFYPSAPGSAWFVLDNLAFGDGRLGGAIRLVNSNAIDPLGSSKGALVSNESILNFGASVTYKRFRIYTELPVPYYLNGSGDLAPALNAGTNPDTVADPRLGVDVLLAGKPGGPLRFGAGAQLIFPSGDRSQFLSDARYRAMFRGIAAGDQGPWSYSLMAGVHVRPLRNTLIAGGPVGNEFLYGAGFGRRIWSSGKWSAFLGPEFFGEAATSAAGSEGLMTARWEHAEAKRTVRVRLGAGHALVHQFGTPAWRVLASVELVSAPR